MNLMPLLFLIACATPEVNYKRPMPDKVTKLCFIGDTGSYDENQKKVADMLLAENCHSIHFLGDIIYERGLRNHHDKNFQKKFWKFYEPITKAGHKPTLYMTMGNHDHHKSIAAWTKLAEKHPKIFYPHPFYFLRYDDVCMTHIDTDYFLFFTNYLQTFTQLGWLKSVNEELKDCRLKIALGHHPYNSSGKDHGNSGFPLRNILKNHVIGKYDYYISGHEHILADEGFESGTRLFISGAGGKVDPGYVNGFLVMTLSGSEEPKVEFRKSN